MMDDQPISSAWGWGQLSDVSSDIIDCPHSTPELVSESSYLLARTSDILTGAFRADTARRVSEETYRERVRRAEPRRGDLLFSREGTYFGIAAEVPPDVKVCLGQRMVLIRPNESVIDSSYLRFWLNGPVIQAQVTTHRDGSVAERLNLPTIRRLPVAIPPMHEQRAIAHILGTLDDKIELNRRMSQTLEEIARTLFKSWFVDFDPVHARAAGREPAGMDAATAALFPSEFEESELGLIPKGWRVVQLGDIAGLSTHSVKPANSPDQLFAHYSIPAFDAGNGPIIEVGDNIKSAKFVVQWPSVLMSKLNPEIDRVWLPAPNNPLPGVSSTEFMSLRPANPVGPYFLYSLARSRDFRNVLTGMVTGTSKSHQRAQPSAVMITPLVRPPDDLIRYAESTLSVLFQKTQAAETESNTLRMIRDALLPKLISGVLVIA